MRNRKSSKWRKLHKEYQRKVKKAKSSYYNNIVKDLKLSKPGEWYSKLKRMGCYDQVKFETVNVESISTMSNQDQAEAIADQYENISKLYEPLKNSNLPAIFPMDSPPPRVHPHEVYDVINNLKNIKGTQPGDIPIKIAKEFSTQLAEPLSSIINTIIETGQYPKLWKQEFVKPVPKCFPPEDTNDLRKISGTKIFSKVTEKFIAQWVFQDMKSHLDPATYGGMPGLSTLHYLIKMLDKILTALDKNKRGEINAVIAEMFDWSKAFDMLCPTLGIKSFIKME